jgi:hypothetical protein
MANAASWKGPTIGEMAKTESVQLLSGYGVSDPETGSYRIPIERAMELEVLEARKE